MNWLELQLRCKFLHLDKPRRCQQYALPPPRRMSLPSCVSLGLPDYGSREIGAPMMSISSLRSHGYLWTILLLVVFANVPVFGATPQESESTPNSLPLGTVTALGSATCLSGATRGAACTSVSVSCPGVPDLKATLSQAFPV